MTFTTIMVGVDGSKQAIKTAEVAAYMARARNADLIVLGRRGLGTLAGLPLGSVSHKVTQMADRPCLTVA